MLQNLGLLFTALALVILCLEVVLSLFWPHKITAKPYFHIQSFFCEYHPLLGWANKPDYRDIVTIEKNRTFMVSHNSRGLRDQNYPYAKARDLTRVLVFGDSFVWGFGVEDDEIFTEVLERFDDGLEVINFGVSGYGTGQSLLYYTDEGFKYDPDFVVYAFYSNDIAESASSISYGYPKPFFIPKSDPLTLTNVPVPRTDETERKLYGNPSSVFGRIKKFLRRHTHTYQFIVGRLNTVPWLRTLFLKLGLADDYRQTHGANIPFYHISNLDEQWRHFYRIAREFRDIVEEDGAKFVLVNIPIKEPSPGVSLGYEDVAGSNVTANENVSFRLQSFADHRGVSFIDLLPLIREYQAGGTPCYNPSSRDIHLNTKGHQLVAESLLQWIEQETMLTAQ